MKTELSIFFKEEVDIYDPVIYEMGKIIESETYSFKIFKIDSDLAYAEIMNLPISDLNLINIKEIKEVLSSKEEIIKVYDYKEFYENYQDIIKF